MVYTCHRSKKGCSEKWEVGSPRFRRNNFNMVMGPSNSDCEELNVNGLEFDACNQFLCAIKQLYRYSETMISII